jgi:glycosyltransferase involved in cell wall biosynthesis
VRLDVVVATYNRSQFLIRTIESLLHAPVPAGMDVTILIMDNNSKDDTESVVREIQSRAGKNIVYVKETNQGLSYARNAGIQNGTGEVVGFIDDDEEIHPDWFNVIYSEFSNPTTHYIGGACLPNLSAQLPKWLPPDYYLVIGVHPATTTRLAYDDSLNIFAWGGNAVFRRSVFDRVGLFSTKSGRTATGLLSNEDLELNRRVRAAGFTGFHVPELIIYHYIPASRLTRKYFRRWRYWQAVSRTVLDKDKKEPVRYLLGIPRYRIGKALKSIASIPRHFLVSHDLGRVFGDELAMWDFMGLVHGQFFFHEKSHYGAK